MERLHLTRVHSGKKTKSKIHWWLLEGKGSSLFGVCNQRGVGKITGAHLPKSRSWHPLVKSVWKSAPVRVWQPKAVSLCCDKKRKRRRRGLGLTPGGGHRRPSEGRDFTWRGLYLKRGVRVGVSVRAVRSSGWSTSTRALRDPFQWRRLELAIAMRAHGGARLCLSASICSALCRRQH